jgi:hypothetical protein
VPKPTCCWALCVSVNCLQAHASDSEARSAAETASEGLRAARIAEMSTTGSMVTLSSLATMDEDMDTLQVCVVLSVDLSW